MTNEKLIPASKLITAIRDDEHIDGRTFARVKKHIEETPAVENEELQFTRRFIHEHGLEFALASAWERRKKDGNT